MSSDKAGHELEGPRPGRPDELEAILETANAVIRVARGFPPTVVTDYPHLYNTDNVDNIIIVKDGDRVASTVAIWTNTIEIGTARLQVGGINILATLPEYRREGLGTAVMEASHQRMRDLGCHVGRLTTDITNWYRRLGWERAGIVYTYEFDRANMTLLPRLPAAVTLRCVPSPFDDATIEFILQSHHADRLGGIRTPALMRTLLGALGDPKVKTLPQAILAESDGQAAAYLLERDGEIIEWGGPGELVAGLLRAWFEASDDAQASTSERDDDFKSVSNTRVSLVAPMYGHSLSQILQPLSLPRSVEYWGMLHIIDPRGILDAFGLQDISVKEENGQFTLERRDARVTVDRCQLAKLLFGPERIADFASDVLPLQFWEWPLEHV